MAAECFRVEPLAPEHHRPSFSSGSDALDRYFHDQVNQDIRRRLAVAYVLVDTSTNAVVGYYTLSSLSIVAKSLPDEIRRRLARYPAFPAVLIGRFAIDRHYQRQGLGGRLLKEGLRRSLEVSQQIGAFAVIVDAKDDTARTFYERYGFMRFLDDEYRMFLPMRTIEQLFPETLPRA